MKKLLGLFGAAVFIVSGGTTAISCSGWSPSGSINEGNSGDSDKNPYSIIDILKTPKENLDVFAKTKKDWNYINNLYSKERDRTKKGVEEFKEWEQNSSGELKENYKKLRLTLEVLYLWYSIISQEADFYLYLYENKIDIDYEKDENLLNNILMINDKTKFLEVSKKTSNLYININNFSNTQDSWWNYISQDPDFDSKKYEKEKESWEYLKNPIMSSKIDKYTKFTNKIDEYLNNMN